MSPSSSMSSPSVSLMDLARPTQTSLMPYMCGKLPLPLRNCLSNYLATRLSSKLQSLLHRLLLLPLLPSLLQLALSHLVGRITMAGETITGTTSCSHFDQLPSNGPHDLLPPDHDQQQPLPHLLPNLWYHWALRSLIQLSLYISHCISTTGPSTLPMVDLHCPIYPHCSALLQSCGLLGLGH